MEIKNCCESCVYFKSHWRGWLDDWYNYCTLKSYRILDEYNEICDEFEDDSWIK